ncbi:hypothetical protein [Nonomuraea sp. NPDC049480]|uniref:hypothetical protein n=1 Tax=Nonomuraea sp. NPDC049480 TaxID=3364353 RepID=UPI0037B28D0C
MTDALIDALSDAFPDRPLRIGTRSSPMAKHQAGDVRDRIQKRIPGLDVELVPMQTSADLWPGDLAELGGKRRACPVSVSRRPSRSASHPATTWENNDPTTKTAITAPTSS